MGVERNKSYGKTLERLCVSVSYSVCVCVCKCSLWCLHAIVKDALCFYFVVEVCFVSSVLATYRVSVSN